ncbi:MAG: O-methyltransferase [Phycisphaerae bacterium]
MSDRIAAAIQRLEHFMTTVEDAHALPRDAAAFVHAMVLATRATRVVEIGTSYGYSALWIASALAEQGSDGAPGRLVTIDHDKRKTDAARGNVADAGLDGYVECRTGTALDVLRDVAAPIDLVLNDADKAHCIEYVTSLAGKLRDRGVVLTDNTVTHADQLAEFVCWVRDRDDFFSTHVPIGNGMEMSVKVT